MGYYTNYSLDQVTPWDSNIKIPDNISEKDDMMTFLSEKELDGVKWYDHFKDMVELSLTNPDTTFKTSGIGEENGDQWKAVFLNGKYKRVDVKIVFDDFSEVKWK